ncbi:MAG: orotidine-5'-phosphate decarboxylase [Clostridia bacterium]|nr:orotidine-5'-phosphate decarboxylase [Clostridia bacterium]
MDKLIEKIIEKDNTPIVAGLDPKIDYVPEFIVKECMEKAGDDWQKGAADALFEFNRTLIDNLYDIVPAVKPQSAYYEMYGIEGLICLQKTISYAEKKGLYVLLDVKRGDIGATAEAYSTAYLGETVVGDKKARSFTPDAVTVNPYLGTDGLKPFVKDAVRFDKDVFVLVKTSNPSSGELQDLKVDGMPIYEKMGSMVSALGADNVEQYGYSRVGAVVGATYPQQMTELRSLMPNTFFLIPGYGAQGGKAEDCALAFDERGLGGIVNSSRGIMCAYKKGDWKPEEFGAAARCEAINMKEALKNCIK